MEKEHIQAEEKAIRYIAKAADGSLRDALSLLDQCVAFYLGQTLTYDNVLDVLGTVDTEIFSGMLRRWRQAMWRQSFTFWRSWCSRGKRWGSL